MNLRPIVYFSANLSEYIMLARLKERDLFTGDASFSHQRAKLFARELPFTSELPR